MSASSDAYEGVRVRLEAYIWPHAPVTDAQKLAFERAVEAQVRFEQDNGGAELPAGLSAVSIGDFSISASGGARTAAYTSETLSPEAWAYLYRAGLLRGAIPQARRL